MLTIINNMNFTGFIPPSNFTVDMGLTDALATASFDVVDVSSSISLDFNQPVMIWDENAAQEYAINGTPIQFTPTINLVNDPSFTNAATSYAKGGAYPGIITFSNPNAIFTFSNQAQTGITNDANIRNTATLLANGYVTHGQSYMFSFYVQATSPVNLNYYFQINWLDANRNSLLSTSTSGVPPTTQTRVHVQGIAPTGAVYAQAQIGMYATSTTNSGTVNAGTLQIEPVWFTGQAMGNGVPITYPTGDCNYYQDNTTILPDGTYARNSRLFYGYIANLEATYDGTKRTYKVDCRAMGDVIENGGIGTPLDVTYTGYTDAGIITDIVSNYFSGLLSVAANHQAQPGNLITGPVIDSISFTDQTFREVLNNIVDITGFAYYVDAFLHLNYNPIPYTYALFSLLASSTVQPDNVTTFAPQEYTYIKDGTQIRNSVKVTGGHFQVTVQDVFNGDGATKVFNLTNIPVSIVTISTNGGTATYAPTSANKIGITGQDTNGTSGVVALMDANNKNVTFNTAPASGTNTVVITYTQNRPVSILVEENTSIGTYGRKFVSKVQDSNLASNAAGKIRGEAEISQWAFPVQNITFKLSSSFVSGVPVNLFLTPGTTIFLTSTPDNLTQQPFVIQTVKITTLGGGVNVYEYEAGVYRPSMRDHLRNIQKSLARNPSTGGTTPIQIIYEVLRDQLLFSDTITITAGAAKPTGTYGSATYGGNTYA